MRAHLRFNDSCPHHDHGRSPLVNSRGAAFAFDYVDAATTNFEAGNERSSSGNAA